MRRKKAFTIEKEKKKKGTSLFQARSVSQAQKKIFLLISECGLMIVIWYGRGGRGGEYAWIEFVGFLDLGR